MKKLKKITDDYSVMESPAPSSTLIDRLMDRATRLKPKKRKLMDHEEKLRSQQRAREKKSNREKKTRADRLAKGLCTRCGKVPSIEGGRMCQKCRSKGALSVSKAYERKRY